MAKFTTRQQAESDRRPSLQHSQQAGKIIGIDTGLAAHSGG
jgi:hypothetical protein